VCLTGCASPSTLHFPPIRYELMQPCGDVIAQPLTTGDQYDLARALGEATKYAKSCRIRMGELIEAVQAREKLINEGAK